MSKLVVCLVAVLLFFTTLSSFIQCKKPSLPASVTENLEPCSHASKNGEYCTLPLLSANPTQIPVGLGEIYCKIQKLENEYSSEKKLIEKYLHKNPVPVVKGPLTDQKGLGLYVVDHHHLIVSMYSASFDKNDFPNFYLAKNRYVIAQIVNDVSSNFTSANVDFWNSMISKGYAYPKDEYGKNLTTAMFMQQLPRDILTMRNDPYRALSYYDRSYGGYGKADTSIYFVDFIWGNFLREFGGPDMTSHLQPFIGIQVKNAPVSNSTTNPTGLKNNNSYTMKEEFKIQKSLIGAAVAISKSSAAKGLPGYMQGIVDAPYCLASYEVVRGVVDTEKKKKIILLSDNQEDEEEEE